MTFRSNDHFGKVVFGQTFFGQRVLGKMAQTRCNWQFTGGSSNFFFMKQANLAPDAKFYIVVFRLNSLIL
jgi:hypothetical protein